MTNFGDYDPDDGWDASDSVVELLIHLGRRVVWLVDHRDDLPARIKRIEDDIEFIRDRIIIGDM